MVGVTVMLLPVPIRVPPQEAVYHLQRALLPREPPLTLRVTAVLPQVVSLLAVMPEAAVLRVLTFTLRDTQAVVLQNPSARTK